MKNWDKIVADFEEDEKKNDLNVNDFFKQIYSNADDDGKRAMLKSLYESKGTTLSTNWDKVKQDNFYESKKTD